MGTQTQKRTAVRFAGFELDLDAGELRHRGDRIKLQEQPFRVLVALIECPGEIVSREDFRQRVWASDTFVDFEHSLNAAIKKLRQALHDDAERPRFIETVPKRGYRFIAPVERNGNGATADIASAPVVRGNDAKRQMLTGGYLAGFLALTAIATGLLYVYGGRVRRHLGLEGSSRHIESLAVLPLRNLSRDPEQEYFSDGITDELITELARFGSLRVISHTSVERYKGTKMALPEIARELGVDAVVEGTVMRSENRVRVTAQLIDARADRHLWAESYERDLRDVLALQDEVAQEIATEIGMNLTASSQVRRSSLKAVDPAANEAYMRGNFYWNRLNCDGFTKALEYFGQAVAKDPTFAPAYVGLAQSYFTVSDWGCSRHADAIAKSKAALLKAIELDPTLGPAHAWLGKLIFFYEWNWPEAEKEFKKAIDLDPNYVPAHLAYSVFLVAMGRQEQSFAEMAKARTLDPTSELTNVIGTYVSYLAHDYDHAIAQGEKTLELYPASSSVYFWLAAAYEKKGMQEQAADAYLKQESFASMPAAQLSQLRSAYRKFGIRGYWQRELEATKGDESATCSKAEMYGHLQEKEKTVEYLRLGVQLHCHGMQFLKVDPVFENLHGDPRFDELVSQLNL